MTAAYHHLALFPIKSTITGPNANDFDAADVQDYIGPDGSRPHIVRFRPLGIGARSAMLEIASNDPDTPVVRVPLSGVGWWEQTRGPSSGVDRYDRYRLKYEFLEQ